MKLLAKWHVVAGIVVSTALFGCASQVITATDYPLLLGASPIGAPQPPVIQSDLSGFGDMALGTLAYDAETQGYTLLVDDVDDGGDAYLAGSAIVDGIKFTERLNLSGTPDQVSSIVLLAPSTGEDANGKDLYPSAQGIFNELLKKYGPEKTTTASSGLPLDHPVNDENFYTWTFQDGRTIELLDSANTGASIIYSEATAPEQKTTF